MVLLRSNFVHVFKALEMKMQLLVHITPHQGSNIHLQIENTSSATPAFSVNDTTTTNHANEQQIILLPKDTDREYYKQDNTPS